MFGVRYRLPELARGSVMPMIRGDVTPADRSPRASPPTSAWNRVEEHLDAAHQVEGVVRRRTVSGRGTPSKKSSCPNGESTVSGDDKTWAIASGICSGDNPDPTGSYSPWRAPIRNRRS